jgi:MoaA/NifB/PqqE/SkfB family radical SAM enzyme
MTTSPTPTRMIKVPDLFRRRQVVVCAIQPLRRCNLRCTHCFIRNDHKQHLGSMDLGTFGRALDAFQDFVRRFDDYSAEIILQGGELHLLPAEDMEAMFGMALDAQIALAGRSDGSRAPSNLNVASNLIGIREDRFDALVRLWSRYMERADAVRSAGVPDTSSFSLVTSFEPDTNRFVTEDVYREWLGNARRIVTSGVPLVVAVTGTKGLVRMGARRVIDLVAQEIGAYAAFDHFAPFGEGQANAVDLTPGYEELRDFMIEYVRYGAELSERLGRIVAVPVPSKDFGLEHLHSRWRTIMSVDYDGTIALDSESAADSQRTRTGTPCNVNDAGPEQISDMIAAAARIRWKRDIMAMGRYGCHSCEHVSYCQGGYYHFEGKFGEGRCPGIKEFVDEFARVSDRFEDTRRRLVPGACASNMGTYAY